jgi:hypothetical protein
MGRLHSLTMGRRGYISALPGWCPEIRAGVVELVDAPDSKSEKCLSSLVKTVYKQ